jgi:hypothetical protein
MSFSTSWWERNLLENGCRERKIFGYYDFNNQNGQIWCQNVPFDEKNLIVLKWVYWGLLGVSKMFSSETLVEKWVPC